MSVSHKPTTLGILTTLVAASLFATASGYQKPRYGGELRRVIFAPIGTFDPILATSEEEIELARNVHATLVVRAADGSYQPGLASSIETVGSPPSSLRIKLREGLSFHGGKPLMAGEAQASLVRLFSLRPELGRVPGLPAPSSIRVVDPLTLDIEVDKQALPEVLELLSDPMASIALPPDSRGMAPGAGPFAIGDLSPGGRIRLVAFPQHYRGRPFIDAVNLDTITDPAEQRRALAGGNWDLCDLPAAAEPPPGVSVVTLQGEETASIRLQLARQPFASPANVSALDAVDRASMVDVILKGRGAVAAHLLSEKLFPPLAGILPARPAAPALPKGSRSHASLIYPVYDTDLALAAERVKFELRDAIAVEPRPVSLTEWRAKVASGDYDGALGTSYLDPGALVLGIVRALGRDLPAVELAPQANLDEAKLVASMLRATPPSRIYLFHRTRRYLVRDGLAIPESGSVPLFDDAWRPKP